MLFLPYGHCEVMVIILQYLVAYMPARMHSSPALNESFSQVSVDLHLLNYFGASCAYTPTRKWWVTGHSASAIRCEAQAARCRDLWKRSQARRDKRAGSNYPSCRADTAGDFHVMSSLQLRVMSIISPSQPWSRTLPLAAGSINGRSWNIKISDTAIRAQGSSSRHLYLWERVFGCRANCLCDEGSRD